MYLLEYGEVMARVKIFPDVVEINVREYISIEDLIKTYKGFYLFSTERIFNRQNVIFIKITERLGENISYGYYDLVQHTKHKFIYVKHKKLLPYSQYGPDILEYLYFFT